MAMYSYCGHPVEIDDFAMSFKQLRVEIYSYVSKHFPELGELSADDYQQKWDAAFEEIVDIAVKYFEENSIVDYPRDKIKSELQGKCYRQFKKICARIDADVKAYQQQASQASGQTVKNMQNNGTSAGGQLAMGAAMLLLSSYGKSSTIEKALKREDDNIRAEFKALKQKLSAYSYLIDDFRRLPKESSEFRECVQTYIRKITVYPYRTEIVLNIGFDVADLTETIEIRRGDLYALFERKEVS